MLKKIWLLFAGLLITNAVFADGDNYASLLNRITLQLKAEQWLETKSALVTIAMNAAITDPDIEKMQGKVLMKLKRIADKGAWHIISYDRQQDKSGLEKIQIFGQARLQQGELSNLREQAKAVSTPGETYAVDSVQFVPSEDELRIASIALRNNIYLQAKTEIDALNKVYPEERFYLHDINFVNGGPMPMVLMANKLTRIQQQENIPLTVDNKLEVQATVVISSLASPNLKQTKLLN